MEKYNRWTIVSYDAPYKVFSNGNKKPLRKRQVVVRCECGYEGLRVYSDLKTGNTKSCGCLQREKASAAAKKTNTTHGHGVEKKRLYNIWRLMRQRCNNPAATGYKDYGGKGIQIAAEWDDFACFSEWALSNGYSDELTIDRVNVDGDYCESNCEWVTRSENISRRNRSEKNKGTKKSRYTEREVNKMVEMRRSGMTLKSIADCYSTSVSHVSRLVNGKLKYLKK